MGKLRQNNSMFWQSLFCISCFALFGSEGVGKRLTLEMKGRPYYKEEAIIKTFEFNGDIIDCIDIYKQPAFDHPLLKNHTIQMKPTFIPERPTGYPQATTSNSSTVEDTHPWLFTKGCSEGSIPIIRTPYNGLVVSNATASDLHMHHPRYLSERDRAKGKKFIRDPTLHEYAVVEFTANKLHGASATFNVQHPSLEGPQEFSVAQMWIASEDRSTTLEAGWTVYPELYGDYRTRLFTLWTDNNDKNWWLRFRGHLVGYWPKSIVPKLGDGAQIHAFGGEILNKRLSGHHTTTHIGSGRFVEEGFKKAAYIKNVLILEDLHSHYTTPSNNCGTQVVTHPDCYNLQLGHHMDGEWGYNFFYGGPSRSTTCT